jgi:CheY-like chemotaxis protein
MPPKLLLADDSITVQRVIALTFAGEGLEVVTVGDGDQAVERIAQDHPEIVLADVSMPGRDGYAVAEFVKRSSDHAPRTRVVLLTGAFEPVDEARTRSLGVDGVLAKPFEPQMAIGLVRRLLDQPPVQAVSGEASVSDAAAAASTSEWGGALGETSALGEASGLAAGYPFEPGADRKDAPVELDDYFRRLDEALATAGLGSSPTPAPVEAVDAVPASAGRANSPMVDASEAPVPARVEAGAASAEERAIMETTGLGASTLTADSPTLIMPPRHESPAGDARSTAPSLVDAFAALLAAEQGDPAPAAAAWLPQAAPAGETDTESLVEQVTRRVLERMTDATIREIVTARVLDVAERVVREEIERIKADAGE